jgi:hypothetical protein
MLGVARYFALSSSDPQSILGADYSEKIAKCADQKITIDFDSEIKVVNSGPILAASIATGDAVVQATGVPLKWDAAAGDPFKAAFRVQRAPMDYKSFAYTLGSYMDVQSCAELISTDESTISVTARPSLNLFGKAFGKTPPPSLVMNIDVSSFEEFKNGDLTPVLGCVRDPLPTVQPYYSGCWTLIGGREQFVAPLNATKTFSGRRGFKSVPGGSAVSCAEVTTAVTVNTNPLTP